MFVLGFMYVKKVSNFLRYAVPVGYPLLRCVQSAYVKDMLMLFFIKAKLILTNKKQPKLTIRSFPKKLAVYVCIKIRNPQHKENTKSYFVFQREHFI